MGNAEKISAANATFGYRKAGRDLAVLANINVNFYEGDFVGVVGLNGTGKSTMLKSLCGLLPLLSGAIAIETRPIKDLSLGELAKKVSITLTEKISGFNLTAYDVVAAGRLPHISAFNTPGKTDLAVVDAALRRCGIYDHRHRRLSELSDGLFQKTVIAKALAQQTPVILLDEPTAFLDYASKYELFSTLKALAGDGKCVVASSHDLDLILKYCNKLLVISDGEAVLLPVAEAAKNSAFKKIGGGFI